MPIFVCLFILFLFFFLFRWLTFSFTDLLAEIYKRRHKLQPPGRGTLAQIVVCYYICRVQEAFNQNIVSAPDCVWWSMSLCVFERERWGAVRWVSDLEWNRPQGKTFLTEQLPVERLHNSEDQSSWALSSSRSSGLTHRPTAPMGAQTPEEGHSLGETGSDRGWHCKYLIRSHFIVIGCSEWDWFCHLLPLHYCFLSIMHGCWT